ncbi:hypothetical protein NKH45_35575 [Mesorhizobium sp. M1156]|uniref:hypothetical protein n=1 Tax=Mesorhizobium sp. M1156 TaxID=2957064 RepID=UPI0033360A44
MSHEPIGEPPLDQHGQIIQVPFGPPSMGYCTGQVAASSLFLSVDIPRAIHLMVLRRLICPSTGLVLQGWVMAASTAEGRTDQAEAIYGRADHRGSARA